MYDLQAVYVDGETKTGKGAAGEAIAEALEKVGRKVYYDVAGDFYRRYTAWVRLKLGLNDDDPLPGGVLLDKVATEVYKSGQAFEIDNERLGNLQRPAISKSVSQLAQLPIAQHADGDWCIATLKRAVAEGAETLVVDGRNPRYKLQQAGDKVGIGVKAVLDLFMTCDPAVAGRRILASRGINEPTTGQLRAATDEVVKRREQDRNRPVQPFIIPAKSIEYGLASTTATQAIERSWSKNEGPDLPVAIKLDNSYLAMEDMLTAVSELAIAGIQYVQNK